MSRIFRKTLEEYISKDDNSIVYAYEIFGVKACSIIAKKYNIPVVSRFQGTIMSEYRYNLINRIRKYPHFQALSKQVDLVVMTDDGTKGDKVLQTVHNTSSSLFLKNGLDLMALPVDTIESSFDKNRFFQEKGLSIQNREMVFLTVSRLVSWKRLDRAINGFSEYFNLNGNGKLIIVGDGDCRKSLGEMVYSLGLKDQVFFVGSVLHDDVYRYMLACDIFISLYDLSNVGNPLLEAMTLGRCIVTLNTGDTNKLIKNGENGILLNQEDLETLGSVLDYLDKNSNLRDALGKSAANYAKKHFYSWEERMRIEIENVKKLLVQRNSLSPKEECN